MGMVEMLAAALAALATGAALAWWLTRAQMSAQVQIAQARADEREARIREMTAEAQQAGERFAKQLHGKDNELSVMQLQLREIDGRLAAADTQLREERKQWEAKMELLHDARNKLGDAFKALSAEALQSSNQNFLELAKETLSRFQAEAKGDLEQRQQAVHALVQPIRQSLDKVHEQIQLVEKTRAQAYGSLTEHINQVVQSQDRLRSETGNLVKALRAPQARGRWGEIQLKRVVEMAGMVEQCDFQQQASVDTDDGRQRPDMVVRLPGGKNIVIDAKVPLAAYLEALEATDDAARLRKLDEHALQVRAHLAKLGSKNYWQQFQPTPEFVVLFLPGESFFSAALQQDPRLIEEGVNQQVIIATPTTLIALLRAVAYGWRQEQVAEHAQKVAALGQELYDRIRAFSYHLVKVGSGLDSAVDSYNKAIGSLETRVLVSARRFKELGSATGQELGEPEQVQKAARAIQAPELTGALATPAAAVDEALVWPAPAASDDELAAPLDAADVELTAAVAAPEPSPLPSPEAPSEAAAEAVALVPAAPAAAPPAAPAAAPPAIDKAARAQLLSLEAAHQAEAAARAETATAPPAPAASDTASAEPESETPAEDPFPSLDEVLAADITTDAAPSIEEIMAMVGGEAPEDAKGGGAAPAGG